MLFCPLFRSDLLGFASTRLMLANGGVICGASALRLRTWILIHLFSKHLEHLLLARHLTVSSCCSGSETFTAYAGNIRMVTGIMEARDINQIIIKHVVNYKCDIPCEETLVTGRWWSSHIAGVS